MKILVDTNIIIDLLAQRKEFYPEAASLFSRADKGEIQLFVSALSFANTHYILNRDLNSSESKKVLLQFKSLVSTINMSDKIVNLALADNLFKDFEDGIQYYSSMEEGVNLILSRNKKDFKNSSIPVMTAKEFIASNSI